MDDTLSFERNRFLLSLREFRPELAEFQALCVCGEPAAANRDFAGRRLQHLIAEGVGLGYDILIVKAQALSQSLRDGGDGKRLAELTQSLLSEALYALTFLNGAPLPAVTSQNNAQKKRRLVVADDDRIVREMMAQLFSESTELFAASNGREAYDFIEQHQPHLVILDDFMPQMTGLKLIELLHESSQLRTIPVIMLTGSDRPRDKERALAAGAVDYIHKPFNPLMLKELVEARLKTSEN